jgi:Bacteriophage tail sheath protein
MPTAPTYPGVYIEEVPSSVKTIAGVATSITAFIGKAVKGPTDTPVRITSMGDFTRIFGGLRRDCRMAYAVAQYYAAGGSDTLIVRVHNSASASIYQMPAGGGNFRFEAASRGAWGDRLEIFVDHDVDTSLGPNLFNLTVNELDGAGNVVSNEVFRNLSLASGDSRYVVEVLAHQSRLVHALAPLPAAPPDANLFDADGRPIPPAVLTNGADGGDIGFSQIADEAALKAGRSGLWAFDNADIFNLMCIAPFTETVDVTQPTWQSAANYCKSKRAFLIVDPPASWANPANVLDATIGIDGTNSPVPTRGINAAVYFPRVKLPDPLQNNRVVEFPPCGLIAGIYARTDASRGVWKAPAGQEASLTGVRELTYKLNDAENGDLNQKGVNALRSFPVAGPVVWGSRTLRGADSLASEWKYVPVRRLALFMEESLYRGTQWVIFEPNDEPLWAQIRLNVGAFMHNLFRQGAFQGSSPRDAYFVRCDSETTTQNDIDRGIVNLEVGFAPLKPAEFLIIKLSQIAGQIQA